MPVTALAQDGPADLLLRDDLVACHERTEVDRLHAGPQVQAAVPGLRIALPRSGLGVRGADELLAAQGDIGRERRVEGGPVGGAQRLQQYPGLRQTEPVGAGLLAAEIADPSAGPRAMASRLLDLLFIKALRAWSDADGAGGSPGRLTAALDRSLGPALWAIHRHPEQPWTVEELAGLASLSRAAFAARFTRLAGDPPARYLARLRLTRAADRIATTTEPVGAIGKALGYESEAAFSRAFAREYGTAPRDWRATRNGQP